MIESYILSRGRCESGGGKRAGFFSIVDVDMEKMLSRRQKQ